MTTPGGTRVRVAMNLLWSVPGVGGSEEYLVRQLAGLSAIDHRFEVDVFAPRGFSDRRPEIAERFTVQEAPDSCTSRPRRVLLENTWLARRTGSHDIVHHGGGTLPRRGNQRTLLTIHDVQWIDYPHYVNRVKLTYLRRIVPSSLSRATRVAVPSRFVAGTLVDAFGVDESKVGVVRHGLEPWFDASVSGEVELRRRFNLGEGPVLVYPAITHPHKNHLFLLRLMSSAAGGWADPNLTLVFAGSAGSADVEVRRAIADMNLGDRVVMSGRVSHADRNGLLALATAMVFPSEYEGFGAPLIEAMRCDTPILCSNRGSVPEVVGDAAVVCDLDARSWVDGLDRVTSMREHLVVAGRIRAGEFTAEKSACDLVAQYDVVMGGHIGGSAA